MRATKTHNHQLAEVEKEQKRYREACAATLAMLRKREAEDIIQMLNLEEDSK